MKIFFLLRQMFVFKLAVEMTFFLETALSLSNAINVLKQQIGGTLKN